MPNHFDENISCYKREVTVSSGARLHNGYIIIKHFNDVSSVNINNRWTPQLDWKSAFVLTQFNQQQNLILIYSNLLNILILWVKH